MKRLLAIVALATIFCLFAGIYFLASRYRGGMRIIYTESNSPNITNGMVHEKAQLQIPAGSTLIVPENALVVQGSSATRPTVFVRKELAVFGHPPKPISILEVRHTLGIAQKTTADTLTIATWGEYTIDGHGGATVDLKFELPPTLKYQRAPNLSGPNNATGPRKEDDSLNEGWTKIETK